MHTELNRLIAYFCYNPSSRLHWTFTSRDWHMCYERAAASRKSTLSCLLLGASNRGWDEEMVMLGWGGVIVISCFCKMGKQIWSYALQLRNEIVSDNKKKKKRNRCLRFQTSRQNIRFWRLLWCTDVFKMLYYISTLALVNCSVWDDAFGNLVPAL